jgi:lipopolysaccharide/colanic/teichoic acid biosynthesis glycosyltransferase
MNAAEYAKRACDIGAAIAGLMLFSPIILIAALAIKVESGGPIFVRVSSEDTYRKSRLLKFRVAMCTNDRETDGPLTRVGRMLARTAIDELPQFVNVLRGDISIFARRDIHRWPSPARLWERQE